MLEPLPFLKALADETRLRILLLLQDQGELCVCEIVHALELSQPKVSRHLAQLRSAGLLCDRRQGQWIYYAVDRHLPAWAEAMLGNAAMAAAGWLENDRGRLLRMGDRPLRQAACC